MRNLILICNFLFCCGFLSGQTEMNQKEAQEFKQKVIEESKKIETVSSEFVQKKHLDFLENDIETFGKMAFKSPNIIKWEYTKPYVYSVLFKEDKLFINDDGEKSDIDLSSNELFESLNDLIVKSVKGDMFDENEFDIQYFKLDKNFRVDFRPKRKEMNAYIQSFQLTFDKETAQVMEVKMIEPSDDYTRIIFKNRKLNIVLGEL